MVASSFSSLRLSYPSNQNNKHSIGFPESEVNWFLEKSPGFPKRCQWFQGLAQPWIFEIYFPHLHLMDYVFLGTLFQSISILNFLKLTVVEGMRGHPETHLYAVGKFCMSPSCRQFSYSILLEINSTNQYSVLPIQWQWNILRWIHDESYINACLCEVMLKKHYQKFSLVAM